ncbi:fatty-acid amide hydrolase 2-like isoform X2 [Leptidea sinapis]|nr:fatty-acid amide hydrolase 2-like isoform X2 [Leptidea sinapis]XP_050664693.1 fatty-acid amide hydrolase 2-like isoform X2 [Leptidea sinapis]
MNLLKQFFFYLRMLFDMTVDFVYGLYWDGRRKTIPPLEKKHAILKESAVRLASMIRNKELKSEELVCACIERIKLVNPYLNAVTDERYEDAIKDARAVDKMIENGLTEEEFTKKPFLGVPFTAKESHAVSGMLHTLGVVARRDARAHEDAECVRLLRAAGAIPVAVTNVPEINKWQETRNTLFGQTNNPYHTGRTVGGSSGGEAALSAALASPISLCSDIGGSTRMPAFYCGLYALNPTAGHTSLKGSALRTGLDPTMASIGFVSKHLGDLAPLTRVVAGDMAPQLNLDREIDIKNVRYFYLENARDLRVSSVCAELRLVMKRVITRLSDEAPAGKSPRPYHHEGFDHMFALWKNAMTKESENFSRMLSNNVEEVHGLTELGRKIIGKSDFTLAAILKLLDDQVMPAVNKQWAEQLTRSLASDLIRLLGDDGVLLLPSAPSPAPYHYSLYLRPFHFSYWGILNVLHMPAVQVPLGVNADGVPLGLQVVAAPRNDALCVSAAHHLHNMFGGFVPPCTILQ